MVAAESRLRRIRVWHLVLIAIVLALVLGGIYAYKLATLKSGTSVDYAQQLYDRVAAQQPAGGDAWSEYAALHAAHQALKDEIRAEAPELEGFVHPDYTSIFTRIPEAPEPTGDAAVDATNAEVAAEKTEEQRIAREWARTALERFPERGIDEQLDALVGARTVLRPKSDAIVLLVRLMPDLGDSRGLARALKARMRLAGERGDHASIAQDFERTLALARHIGAQGMLIERLVGIAITALALGEIREQLPAAAPTPDACRALLGVIDRQAHLPPSSFHVECERLQLLDTLQLMHSDDGHGDGIRILTVSRRLADQAPGPGIINVLGLFEPSKKEMFSVANAIYDGLARSSDVPRRENRKLVFDHDAHVAKLGPKYKLLTLFGSAFDKSFAANDQLLMDLAGTRTLIAIRLFELENGRLPSSLAELVPRYFASDPNDPYAPDGRLRLKLLADPNEQGRRFILYSVGADGSDNDGTPASSAYDALRAGAGAGTDFIVNDADERR